ncbi:hypothetical protein WJX74_005204 [Apatococcus lobatus]|uniref:Uncharacterized protein n=1 Tax=Apatococcus lobatus TaxID=904363 RepID=A0AAW1R1K0_9CHLO
MALDSSPHPLAEKKLDQPAILARVTRLCMLSYIHRSNGDIMRAREACLQALHSCALLFHEMGEDPSVDACRDETAEQMYMQALGHLQRQDAQSADSLLSLLGICFRLGAAAFERQKAKPDSQDTVPVLPETISSVQMRTCSGIQPSAAGPAVHPIVFQKALPGQLLQRLQDGFAPDSCFWQCHGYHEPSSPFFSYYYSLGKAPSNTVEAAIQTLAGSLRSSHSARPWMQDVVAAEWWAHTRPAEGCHQLHFDMDETRLRQGSERYALKNPAASTVIFLSAAATSGPTLILDQRPQDTALAQRGWCIPPDIGSCVTYPGNLLHGVLPGIDEVCESQSQRHAGSSRTTLVVAWWRPGPQPQPSCSPLGPMRTCPVAVCADSREDPERGAHSPPRSPMEPMPVCPHAPHHHAPRHLASAAGLVASTCDPVCRPPGLACACPPAPQKEINMAGPTAATNDPACIPSGLVGACHSANSATHDKTNMEQRMAATNNPACHPLRLVGAYHPAAHDETNTEGRMAATDDPDPPCKTSGPRHAGHQALPTDCPGPPSVLFPAPGASVGRPGYQYLHAPQQPMAPQAGQAAKTQFVNQDPVVDTKDEIGHSWAWLADFFLNSTHSPSPCTGSSDTFEAASDHYRESFAPSCAVDSRQSKVPCDSSSALRLQSSHISQAAHVGGIKGPIGDDHHRGLVVAAAGGLECTVPHAIGPIWEHVQPASSLLLEQLFRHSSSAWQPAAGDGRSIPAQPNTCRNHTSADVPTAGHMINRKRGSPLTTEDATGCLYDNARHTKRPRLKRTHEAAAGCSSVVAGMVLCNIADGMAAASDSNSSVVHQGRVSSPVYDHVAQTNHPIMDSLKQLDSALICHGEVLPGTEAAAADIEAAAIMPGCEAGRRPSIAQRSSHLPRAEQREAIQDEPVVCWLAAAALPPLRFFLRAAEEIRNVYML